MALHTRTVKCAFPGVPEHTFDTRERNVEFCPEHRQAGSRLQMAIAPAGRKTKAKVVVRLPPPPVDMGLLCRTCRRRASGPLCYTCLGLRGGLDSQTEFPLDLDHLPQPSPSAPKCGQCNRPRNPFCDRCLDKLLGIDDWD